MGCSSSRVCLHVQEEMQGDARCANACGRPKFGHYTTCCTRCKGPHGPHARTCMIKATGKDGSSGEADACSQSCGRRASAAADGVCCKSCAYLHGRGHTAECDVNDNSGMVVPWYWRQETPDFHDEREGDYVLNLGNKLIQNTLPTCVVCKCIRIEDSSLWSGYAQCRAEIRSKSISSHLEPKTSELLGFSAASTLDRSVNEAWLFHGTSEEAAFSIAKSDFHLPNAEGHFGKGLYFAELASKSHPYCKETAEGLRVMLLCRVTLGSVLQIEGKDEKGEERLRGTAYDSLLGTTDAREFLIYNIRQAYPEYIMYYKIEKCIGDTPEAALKRVMEMGFSESQARVSFAAVGGGCNEQAIQAAIAHLIRG